MQQEGRTTIFVTAPALATHAKTKSCNDSIHAPNLNRQDTTSDGTGSVCGMLSADRDF